MSVFIEIDDEHDIKVTSEEDNILIEISESWGGKIHTFPKDVARSLAFVIIGMTDGMKEERKDGRGSGSTSTKQIRVSKETNV